MGELKTVDFTAKHGNFEVLDKRFTRCRVYVMASGRNANGSDITYEAMEKCIEQLPNTPIVGHLFKRDDHYVVGGHDSKVVIDDENGFQIINETVPFGVIPENANPKIEKVLEPDGKTYNHYLSCDALLWTGRYNIMDAKYSDDVYFNQSCELLIDNAEYDKDSYLVIKAFTLDALCLLGKSDNPKDNTTPCFASCRVERLKDFSINDNEAFKQEFSLLMQELKTFALENKPKMEESKDMTEKVFELLSAITFKCNDADVAKYAILSISDTEANVIDKEDEYKAYSIPYSVTEGEEPEVTLDFDGKVEKSVGVMDKVENDFSIKAEIDSVASVTTANAVTEALENFESATVKEMTEKCEKLEADYNSTKATLDEVQAKLDVFEAEKQEAERKLHEKEIDDVIETYASKMGTYADFLLYRSKVDYSKTKEQVNTDMLILLGKANMGQKSTFSFNPVVTGVPKEGSFESENGNGRYGDLFDKVNK